jgi:hypothetical protein
LADADIFGVAQVSQPAVSPISKSAGRRNFGTLARQETRGTGLLAGYSGQVFAGKAKIKIMKRVLAALILVAIVPGCTTSPSRDKQSELPFAIVRTHFLGSLWNEAHARASIISQDGGESFVVPGGAIWAYGDTFKGSRSSDGTPHFAGGSISPAIAFLADSAVSYPPAFNYLVSSNGDAISPFELLPTEQPAQNYRIWPLGGIYLNGQYYLYYSLINVFGTGSWDFRCVGSGLGRSPVALGRYSRLQSHGNWRFPVDPTQVIEAEGWLYLFSVETCHGESGAALARVRPGKIEDPAAYEFYAGAGPKFSPNQADATILVENVPGQVTVAWNPYLKKYVMASSSDFDHPSEIRFLAADAPYGPWSPPVARIQVPDLAQGKEVEMAYCTYFHPELFREDGRVMVLTYSLGLKDSGFDANCEMVEVEINRSNP